MQMVKPVAGSRRRAMMYPLMLAVGLVTVFAFFWIPTLFGGPGQLVFGKGTFKPDGFTAFGFWASLAIAGLSLGFYFAFLWKMQSDFDAHVVTEAQSDTELVAPVTRPPTLSPQASKAWTVSQYEARGFKRVKSFEFSKADGEEGPENRAAELYLGEEMLERDSLWFRRGALVYQDGNSVDLKAVVLYGDESWLRESEISVAQKRRGRPVHIEKALDRPFLSRNLASSHYAVCIGLASSESGSVESANDELAGHRAANLCRAISKLGFKGSEFVRGLAIGHANVQSDDKEVLARQRAVVIIGVDVIGQLYISDLVRAAVELVTLNGVHLGNYSRSATGYWIYRVGDTDEYDGTRRLQKGTGSDASFFILKQPNAQ
jgi:hypothetical protein